MPREPETPKGAVSSTFFISGRQFDPDSLSELIGIKPSEIWRQKNPTLMSRNDLPQVEWRYCLVRRAHWSLDSAIREMLNIFSPRSEQIGAFTRRYDCEAHLRLILHHDETVLVYEISADMIALLAALSCSLSFHVDYDCA